MTRELDGWHNRMVLYLSEAHPCLSTMEATMYDVKEVMRYSFNECLDEGDSVTEALRRAIDITLQVVPDGGWVDSYALADAVCQHRPDASAKQQRDYVQHLLREATHVCRYTNQHHYRVHLAERCSDKCAEHGTGNRTPKAPVEYCQHCFLAIPSSGECGNCV